MFGMFWNCSSLKSLPDISQWNTSNVTTMGCMFSDCNSLTSLPDISKWNTSNVTSMEIMFWGCSSLKSFPDILNGKLIRIKKIIPKKFQDCCIY